MGAAACSASCSQCGKDFIPTEMKRMSTRMGSEMSSMGSKIGVDLGAGHGDDEEFMATTADEHLHILKPTGVMARKLNQFDVHATREGDEVEKRRRQDRLFEAVRAGDFKGTVEAICAGALVEGRTLRGQSPLMLASASLSRGAMDTVKFLFESQANVEGKDEVGWTPLMHAARNSQLDSVLYLVEKGASVRARANDGKTSAMLASMDGGEKIVCELINRKCDIDKKDDRGWSLLFYAIEDNRLDLVRWLLKKSANPKDKSKEGMTAIHVAAEAGDRKVGAQLLKKGAPLNSKNNTGQTPLMSGLRAYQEEFVDWLLECSADVSIRNNKDEDACDIAESLGLNATVNKILAKARLGHDDKAL